MEDNAFQLEPGEHSALFNTRLTRLTLRDLLTIGGFAFMLLSYQFSIRAQLEQLTEKVSQVDRHLANTDRIMADEMVPRKEYDAARVNQEALQREFVQYLMEREKYTNGKD
jgi:hypothetical protein